MHPPQDSDFSQVFTRVNNEDVGMWFGKSWTEYKNFSNDIKNTWVAGRINTIVDFENARSQRNNTLDALRERRGNYQDVRKHARALQKSLQPISQYLQYEEENLRSVRADALVLSSSASQIQVIEEARRALGNLLNQCEPPSLLEHQDPILWIAAAAEEAWGNKSAGVSKATERRPSFSKAHNDPLVKFIRLVLEGIGFATKSGPGNSRQTISEHLRVRQNRASKRQSAARAQNDPQCALVKPSQI